jgi:15-cis-phytoene synthase
MDLQPRRFRHLGRALGYIWKVACAVGLVSIRLFGCTEPGAETYAVALGRALQLTNILRDVREDLDNGGRIYLPLDDLARFGYSEEDLTHRIHDGRFLKLMEFQADRAQGFFREAADTMPAADRRALRPARIMADIYQHLLERMRRDGFRVFDRRYSVSRPRKLAILSKHLIADAARDSNTVHQIPSHAHVQTDPNHRRGRHPRSRIVLSAATRAGAAFQAAPALPARSGGALRSELRSLRQR